MARTVPVTTYEVPGNLVTGELWNAGPKALNDFLSNRPTFNALQSLSQSISSGVWTAIQYATNQIDTDAGHNTITNNTRYTCQVGGWYWVKGSVSLNPTGAGNVAARIDTNVRKNGVSIPGSSQFLTKGASVNSAQQCSAIVHMVVGDYVEIWLKQSTGISIFTDFGFGIESGFNAMWLHT